MRATTRHTPTAPVTEGAVPVACSLPADAVPARVEHWRTLLARARARREMDGGVRVEFARDTDTTGLLELVSDEQDCCAFLSFTISVDRDAIALEVRAPDHALPVVRTLFSS